MEARRGPWIFTACLVFSLAVLGASPPEDDSPKDAARKEIEALMQGGEWKEAVKSIKAYIRKHADTDEEKEEAKHLLGKAEGSIEIDRIEAGYRKKQRVREPVRKLNRFLEEYADFPELVERGSTLLDVIRSEFVLVLEDFEEWGEDEEDEDRITKVSDRKLVRHGKYSCRWRTGMGWDNQRFDSPQPDWTAYDFFCIWIYNERKDARPGQIRIEPVSGSEHYFSYLLTIDWTGWREIRVPLKGAKGFSKRGNADWGDIECFDLYHSGWSGHKVEVIIDDIRLEKAVK